MAIVEITARGSTAWSDRLSSSLPSYLLYNKTVKFSNVWPGLNSLVLKQLLNVFNVSFRILVILVISSEITTLLSIIIYSKLCPGLGVHFPVRLVIDANV